MLVTGMSGTGKSSVLEVLAARGHAVVDTDADEWSRHELDDDGLEDWVWRLDAVGSLLDAHGGGHLFVAGCKTNQRALYDRFDLVVVLRALAATLVERLATRTTNPYGTSADELALVLTHLRDVEPRLLATASASVDATAPLEVVADELERLAEACEEGVDSTGPAVSRAFGRMAGRRGHGRGRLSDHR